MPGADPASLLSARALAIDESGIRRIWKLAAGREGVVNLSIGQPDFPVAEELKAAAADAIRADKNGYTPSHGIPAVRHRIAERLRRDIGWSCDVAAESGDGPDAIVTSGTSGALLLAMMALVGPGDEAVLPDPYFVSYPALAEICGGRAVLCDTYPDFRMTAERVEPLLTERTKVVLVNSPSNPAGVVLREAECRDLLELCRSRGVILLSDEIYDDFTFSEGRTQPAAGDPAWLRCPSPARFPGSDGTVLLVRGFGKTYGVTGWRLGYAAGPRAIIDAMARLQQYTFVCPPTPLQAAIAGAFELDLSDLIEEYEQRRELVHGRLSAVANLPRPGGAFYAFFEVPGRLGVTASEVVERFIDEGLLVIPGRVFSSRDTHVRLSFAADRERLERGLAIVERVLGA